MVCESPEINKDASQVFVLVKKIYIFKNNILFVFQLPYYNNYGEVMLIILRHRYLAKELFFRDQLYKEQVGSQRWKTSSIIFNL